MADESEFTRLLKRVYDGQADAAEELVRRYQMAIRVAVRTRLSDPALRRQLDSMDICQSVLASFFLRAAAREYDLQEPAQLVALLTKMARNKLAMHARGQYRQRRDIRRDCSLADNPADTLAESTAPDPQHEVANRDLLERAYQLMEVDVRKMVDLRVCGAGWSEIANELGGTADARRKQFTRAIDKIAESLGID